MQAGYYRHYTVYISLSIIVISDMQRQTKSAAAQFSMTLLGKEKKSKHNSSKTFIDYLLNLNYEFHQPSFSLVGIYDHTFY